MIVNHSHRFIFVHVPKAAGTSVSELFSKFSAYSDLEVGGTELGEALQNAYKRRFRLTKHSTAQEIRAVVGDETWKGYYSFAFVRDPYARAQSTFHFMKRWHGNKDMKQLAFMEEFKDFRSFVMSEIFEKQTAHRLLWPQTRWLMDAEGRRMVDFIGRLESLDEDIHTVLSTAPGLVAVGAAPEEAPTKNKSTSTDRALYELLAGDDEAERRIYEAYRGDFEEFGYPRFDKTATPPPLVERTPNVAPILTKAEGGADKPGRHGKPGKGLGKKANKLKLGKQGKMLEGDVVSAEGKDAA